MQCKQCNGMSIELKHNRCLFKDKQTVRLQENPEDIPQVQLLSSASASASSAAAFTKFDHDYLLYAASCATSCAHH